MSEYPFVPLGEVCDFVYGDSLKETDRKGGSVPVYGSNGIVGWHDRAITRGETIIIGRKGSIGEVHLSKIPCWAIDTTYYIDKTKVPCDLTWLYYTLKALDLTRLNKSAAVPGLNRDDAYEQIIPLPPLAEQKRIASLLARADRLRQLRRTANALADSLLQSVFLEMFGEPEENPKGWAVFELGEIVEINPSGRPNAKTEQPTSFLPMTLVDPSHIYSDTLDVKRFEDVSTGYTYFEENDVLFAKITPCMENGNIVIAKNLLNGFGFGSTEFHVIRPNEKANSAWLYAFVKRPEFRKEATRWFRGTAGQQRVPSDFLESYRVPLPPLALQEEFARVAARVESLRGRMAEAERQAEGLFQSLLAESFDGRR